MPSEDSVSKGRLHHRQPDYAGRPTYSGAQLNSMQQEFENLHAGRLIGARDVGVCSATYEIADAFPANADAALTLQMKITYLGSTETGGKLYP
ncbi:hypothetical protein ACTGJ9_037000 [Bradyrhizobium sp. RDM12]